MLIQNLYNYEYKFTRFNYLTLLKVYYLLVHSLEQFELVFEYISFYGLRLFLHIYKYLMGYLKINQLNLIIYSILIQHHPLKIENYNTTENELIITIGQSKPYLNFFLFIFKTLEPFYLVLFWYKKITMLALLNTILID